LNRKQKEMAKIPISIQKIKVELGQNTIEVGNDTGENVKYLISLSEKNNDWQRSILADRNDLIKLRDEINFWLEKSTTSEILKINHEKAKIVDVHYSKDELCQNCTFKLTHNCKTCLFVLQSPLERKLFLELNKVRINFQTQYALNWQGQNISIEGKTFENPLNNFKEVLTVVDFYVEKRGTKLCVYTDGHSYHERTEEQATRDRNIDRKLQELGFQVLRYTGKEVNENLPKIIKDIQKWIE
jgi:hypothetical protein